MFRQPENRKTARQSENILDFTPMFRLPRMKMLKDSLIYLFGELFAKVLPFLLLPYLTRKLDVAGFGEMSYYQTILSLLGLFFGLSQDGALTRYVYFYGKRNVRNLMHTGYAYIFLLTGLGLIWAWTQQSLILAAVVATACSQSILSTQLAWRQCQKHALAYTAIQTGSGILSSVLTVIILENTTHETVAMRFVALFLGNLWVAMIAYYFVTKEKKTGFTWYRMWCSACYMVAFGAPLLLHHASHFIKGQLDRMVIYQHYSATDLGIYAAGLQLAAILSVLLMAINKAIVPHYYQALKHRSLNAKHIRRYAIVATMVSPIFAIIAYLLPEKVFTWFLGANYVGIHDYICLFLLGNGLTLPYFLLVNYLFYYGKNKLISLISLASTGIYLVALWGLTPLGLRWIPWAMCVGNAAILPILYHFVREPQTLPEKSIEKNE